MNTRKADYPIDEIFLNRWSPRAFKKEVIKEELLMSILEAARWAPSGSNKQPWRFILATTEEDKATFDQFIMDGNLAWCRNAPVYALLISDTEASPSHKFDAGAAWGYLALQAHKNGLATHAMGGIYKDKAKEILHIPEQYEVQICIAIGYQDDKNTLDEILRERETPSGRNSLDSMVMYGKFE